jgi:hypothetical protein
VECVYELNQDNCDVIIATVLIGDFYQLLAGLLYARRAGHNLVQTLLGIHHLPQAIGAEQEVLAGLESVREQIGFDLRFISHSAQDEFPLRMSVHIIFAYFFTIYQYLHKRVILGDFLDTIRRNSIGTTISNVDDIRLITDDKRRNDGRDHIAPALLRASKIALLACLRARRRPSTHHPTNNPTNKPNNKPTCLIQPHIPSLHNKPIDRHRPARHRDCNAMFATWQTTRQRNASARARIRAPQFNVARGRVINLHAHRAAVRIL